MDEVAEALEIAGRYTTDFDRRLALVEDLLAIYRRGWSDGADHILAKFGEQVLRRSIKP